MLSLPDNLLNHIKYLQHLDKLINQSHLLKSYLIKYEFTLKCFGIDTYGNVAFSFK